ncbi:MAG TPA: hypothetical protein VNM47_18265 [Terriglobia bacterium]|nr:hypothetical protein [Terriglobia bacterium]
MRSLLVIFFAGTMLGVGQVPEPALQIDLQSHGWRADHGALNGTMLPYRIDFANDGSLWVAFPSGPSNALQTREASGRYGGKVLHIAASGEIAGDCDTGPQRWEFLRLFAQRAGGFTLETAGKLVAYDAHCKERATFPTDEWTEISPSPDRALIYARTRDNHVRVLNSNNLQVTKELDLPESVQRNHVLFGDQSVIFPVRVRTRGCWQSNFSRIEINTGRITPWLTLECARFNLLGDGHVIYTKLRGDNPLEITGESGVPTATYKPPHGAYIDRKVLVITPVVSPRSLRVVEELIKAKGRHPALDVSGKFVGREIVLLDMHTGTALLSIRVPMDTHTYSYALSRDGKKLAVLRDSRITVYSGP